MGRILLAQAADQVKKCSMELGGNAPFIVFDDADLDAAVEGAILCKFRNNGQTCVCANRIYVQTGVYDAFAEKLAARLEKMTVGDGLEDGTDLGPLIDEAAVDKVREHIADAQAKGASVFFGGQDHALGRPLLPAHHRHRRHDGDAVRPRRRRSARSRRYSASRPGTRSSRWPTTRSSASRATSTRATSAGSPGCRRRWNTASSA